MGAAKVSIINDKQARQEAMHHLLLDLQALEIMLENDLFETGVMKRALAVATPSPAMDISVPSNFERLLFEVSRRDGDMVRGLYATYAQSGEAVLPEAVRGALACTGFSAQALSNGATMTEMQRYYDETGALICPHTAVGTAVARKLPATEAATVVLSTAHAAKFPETVIEATGFDAPLPARCAQLLGRGEVFTRMEADLGAVKAALLG